MSGRFVFTLVHCWFEMCPLLFATCSLLERLVHSHCRPCALLSPHARGTRADGSAGDGMDMHKSRSVAGSWWTVEANHYDSVVANPDVMYTVVLHGRDVSGRVPACCCPTGAACVMRRGSDGRMMQGVAIRAILLGEREREKTSARGGLGDSTATYDSVSLFVHVGGAAVFCRFLCLPCTLAELCAAAFRRSDEPRCSIPCVFRRVGVAAFRSSDAGRRSLAAAFRRSDEPRCSVPLCRHGRVKLRRSHEPRTSDFALSEPRSRVPEVGPAVS